MATCCSGNKILGNTIQSSSGDGIVICGGAHHNTLGMNSAVAGVNSIIGRNGQGVLLSGSATSNSILVNAVESNGKNGIELKGVGTYGSVIFGTHIAGSAWDGINERNGAGGNRWTQVDVTGSGGLPIDKNNVGRAHLMWSIETCRGTEAFSPST